MNLSDIKGERTFDVIADIIEPIANIASDKEASEMFRRKKVPDGMEAKDFLIGRLKKSVPILLRTHKQDIIDILASIEGVPADEYTKSLNLVKLTKDAINLITDQTFLELFISAQDSPVSSGSAQESITA